MQAGFHRGPSLEPSAPGLEDKGEEGLRGYKVALIYLEFS